MRPYVVAAVLAIGAAQAARAALARQAVIARRRIGKPLGELAPDADRLWRASYDREPLRLLLLGDSIAAGLGAERPKDSLGGRLARALGRAEHRPVLLRTAAIVGSESSELGRQIDAVAADPPADVAVIVVGGNDVTHRVPVSASVLHLSAAVARLRDRGIPVVVGTCPDLGALRAVPQPLRAFASQASRRLARAQAAAARREGAEVVSLRRAVGPFFLDSPEEMFSLDRFHPSPLGYRRTADALLPAVLRVIRSSVEEPVR